jgi:hypothetical protein
MFPRKRGLAHEPAREGLSSGDRCSGGRLLMRLPDNALSGVEKVKNVFGKEARVIGYSEKQQPRTSSAPEPKRA